MTGRNAAKKGKAHMVAVTGGTGFVGGHLLRTMRDKGNGIRSLTRGKKTTDPAITWVEGALDQAESLSALCMGADCVVHAAGLIRGGKAAFEAVNVEGTAAMIEAARSAGVRRFILISSLAAREPGLSHYGRSKADAEALIRASGLDWTIIRPPAVYGPGDREMLELFRMAKLGLIALPPRGRFSLIHVEDLCHLILATLDTPESHFQIYEPDDARQGGWDHHHFARTLGALFDRNVMPVSMPRLMMRAASQLDRLLRGKHAKLTADRVSYFCHPDWVVTAENQPPLRLWKPNIDTVDGLKQTAEWYRGQKWL